MYTIITITSIGGIIFSWLKFRDILHPHFVLTTIMFFMFSSDFIVRGYQDKNITSIDIQDVELYQLIILAIITTTYVITYIIAKSYFKGRSYSFANLLNLILPNNESSSQIIPLFAWVILILEILKRLYFSDWSIESMLLYSFGPRFNRPWASGAGNLGDEKFLFSLIGMLFPLAGLVLSADAISSHRVRRLVSALGYLIVLAFVIGVGSRTPIVLLIVFPMIFLLRSTKSVIKRCIAILVAIFMIASITSITYNNRDRGLISFAEETNTSSFIYHQDDSYYRAIYALNHVEKTYERWEVMPFVGASFLNFIPRFIWPEKPALTKEYWGNFKLDYVTITLIGELAALFGIAGGAMISVLIGIACFFFLMHFYKRIYSSYDLLLYILGSLYIYMVFRSLLNITQFVYMFVFFLIILKIDQRIVFARNKKLFYSRIKVNLDSHTNF